MKKYISNCYIVTASILFVSVFLFTNTKAEAATVPVFNNSAATITNIIDDGARLSATITSVGGENVSARGFIIGYSNSSIDTDFPISVYDTSATSYSAGSYSLSISYLSCGKTYYVRAIATNSAGTTKGDAKSFTTLPCSGTTQYTTDLTGWAWSSNTGWLSLNCANTMGTCANSPFKVTIDNTTGLLSGYAWSSNIGWVKFDGLSDYPVTVPQRGPASIGLQFGTTTGWIRACVGTVSGDCSTMESRTDGWDGWIELSGVNHLSTQISNPINGGVRINTGSSGVLGGNAWGDSIVGWLRFFGFGFLSGATALPTVTPTPSVTPEVISASCTKVKTSTGDSLTGNGNITTGDSVIFTVSNPTPVGRTYNYKWYNGESTTGQVANQNYTYTYNTAKTILSTWVTVIDTSASPLSQVTVQCGKITVSDPELSLLIGTNGSSASSTSATVRRGGLFGLSWKNTLNVDPFTPNYYQCDPSIDNSVNVSLTKWNDFVDSYAISGINGTVSGLKTPQTGEFEFKITCSPTGTAVPKPPASVILKVISSSGNEF